MIGVLGKTRYLVENLLDTLIARLIATSIGLPARQKKLKQAAMQKP